MLKYLLGITLLFFGSICLATEIKIDYETQTINTDGLTYTTAIISEPLSTTYELTDQYLILSNEYLASSTSKTAIFYVFVRGTLVLDKVLSITFKPLEETYVGWEIKPSNSIHIKQIDDVLLEQLDPSQEYDYQITKSQGCRNIKYLLAKQYNYEYCSNSNNFYHNPKEGFFLPVFNDHKKLIRMDSYFLEKPGLPIFSELKAKSTNNLSMLISSKTYLHKLPNEKTKMYLIKGDKVTLLDKKTDESGQEWYFINYKGKKDLNMWIKAEAVGVPKSKDIPKEESPVSEKVSNVIEKPTISQDTVATTETIKVPDSKDKVSTTPTDKSISTQVEQEKKASGSVSLSLIASLLGLFAFRFS